MLTEEDQRIYTIKKHQLNALILTGKRIVFVDEC